MQTIALILIGIILVIIVHQKPIYGLIIAIFFATLGELGRLPDSTGLPYLVNDLFIPVLIIIWSVKKLALKRSLKIPPLLPSVAVWIILAGFSLLINTFWLTTSELKESSLYLIRFVEYFFLYLIASDELTTEKNKKTLFISLIGGAILISVFGFIQLKLYPSFFELGMQGKGWDPHIGRLLSTWFDPNFVGGLLAFVICILFGIGLSNYKNFHKKTRISIIYGLTSSILLIALYLTYSRSAYLAFGVGIISITAIKSRKLLIIGLAGMALLFITVGQAQSRFFDLWESFQSIMGLNDYATLFNPDATSRLRIDSWTNAVSIIKEYPFFGVGYNAFKYAQWNHGLINSLDAHYATGSDSTILTIWATTGIFGLIAYLWFYTKTLIISFKNSSGGYSIGLTGGLIALLVHSTFVNTLLFPHILVFFWISIALSTIMPPRNSTFQSPISNL